MRRKKVSPLLTKGRGLNRQPSPWTPSPLKPDWQQFGVTSAQVTKPIAVGIGDAAV